MFDLSDALKQAQANPAFEGMIKQFGIPMEQATAAMQAMLPAFTLGLNNATQSPSDFAALFGQFAATPGAMAMMQNPLAAGPATIEAGQAMMKQMFGSPALANQIAQQAATTSGVATELVSTLMPFLASTLVGELMKGAMSGQNPLGAVLSSVMGQLAPSNASGGLLDMITGMIGGFMGQKPATPGIPGFDQLAQMMQQMQAANPLLNMQATPSEVSGPRSLGQQAADTWTSTFGQMFQMGREMQEKQIEQASALFEQFGKRS
ncbi:MAG: DUF937 domain-containing protein [Alphaproteobacteria bacterium]